MCTRVWAILRWLEDTPRSIRAAWLVGVLTGMTFTYAAVTLEPYLNRVF